MAIDFVDDKLRYRLFRHLFSARQNHKSNNNEIGLQINKKTTFSNIVLGVLHRI